MNNADIPAMPVNAHDYHNNGGYECESFGLTKREHFAAMAMQGICASGPTISNQLIASEAVVLADLLLKELEK
jgi:hypothetical protein